MLKRCLTSLTAVVTSAALLALVTDQDHREFPATAASSSSSTVASPLSRSAGVGLTAPETMAPETTSGVAATIAEWLGQPAGVLAQPRWSQQQQRFEDRDGDLLPDSVEHVLLLDQSETDSDDDGVDDFLHAAAGFFASIDGRPQAQFLSADHLLRTVTTIEEEGQDRGVWVHLLLRLVGGDLAVVHSLDPYLDHWGQRVSLLPLVQSGPLEIAMSTQPNGDLWVRASIRMMSEAELRPFMPCTIGASGVLDQRATSSGSYVQSIDGVSCVLVATGPKVGLLQTLSMPRIDDPFWTTNRICMLRLALVGTTAGGVFAEVTRADCVVGRPNTACPPNCTGSAGRLVFFPDGLRTVTGGSD